MNPAPKCRHRTVREVTRPFLYCLNPTNCHPRAHGNVMYIQTCEQCGAQRRLNSNRGPAESTGWVRP